MISCSFHHFPSQDNFSPVLLSVSFEYETVGISPRKQDLVCHLNLPAQVPHTVVCSGMQIQERKHRAGLLPMWFQLQLPFSGSQNGFYSTTTANAVSADLLVLLHSCNISTFCSNSCPWPPVQLPHTFKAGLIFPTPSHEVDLHCKIIPQLPVLQAEEAQPPEKLCSIPLVALHWTGCEMLMPSWHWRAHNWTWHSQCKGLTNAKCIPTKGQNASGIWMKKFGKWFLKQVCNFFPSFPPSLLQKLFVFFNWPGFSWDCIIDDTPYLSLA